jgi:hypothetical protein
MKAFVGLCGPLDCGLLAFGGTSSPQFLMLLISGAQHERDIYSFHSFHYQCRRIGVVEAHGQGISARRTLTPKKVARHNI